MTVAAQPRAIAFAVSEYRSGVPIASAAHRHNVTVAQVRAALRRSARRSPRRK